MRRARFLASVRRDLLEILTYVADASGSVAVAETFVAKLRARCHQLAAHGSQVGRARPELRSEIRSAPFGNYVIFFRYRSDVFEVVKIIERHRDIEAVFGSDEDP